MTLHMPPAEPPAIDVQDVRERLQTAREQLEAAGARSMLVAADRWPAEDYLRPVERMRLDVLRRVRDYEAQCWAGYVRAIEAEARAAGLDVS